MKWIYGLLISIFFFIQIGQVYSEEGIEYKLWLASQYAESGRQDLALTVLTPLLEVLPVSEQRNVILYNIGTLWAQKHKFEEAYKSFNEINVQSIVDNVLQQAVLLNTVLTTLALAKEDLRIYQQTLNTEISKKIISLLRQAQDALDIYVKAQNINNLDAASTASIQSSFVYLEEQLLKILLDLRTLLTLKQCAQEPIETYFSRVETSLNQYSSIIGGTLASYRQNPQALALALKSLEYRTKVTLKVYLRSLAVRKLPQFFDTLQRWQFEFLYKKVQLIQNEYLKALSNGQGSEASRALFTVELLYCSLKGLYSKKQPINCVFQDFSEREKSFQEDSSNTFKQNIPNVVQCIFSLGQEIVQNEIEYWKSIRSDPTMKGRVKEVALHIALLEKGQKLLTDDTESNVELASLYFENLYFPIGALFEKLLLISEAGFTDQNIQNSIASLVQLIVDIQGATTTLDPTIENKSDLAQIQKWASQLHKENTKSLSYSEFYQETLNTFMNVDPQSCLCFLLKKLNSISEDRQVEYVSSIREVNQCFNQLRVKHPDYPKDLNFLIPVFDKICSLQLKPTEDVEKKSMKSMIDLLSQASLDVLDTRKEDSLDTALELLDKEISFENTLISLTDFALENKKKIPNEMMEALKESIVSVNKTRGAKILKIQHLLQLTLGDNPRKEAILQLLSAATSIASQENKAQSEDLVQAKSKEKKLRDILLKVKEELQAPQPSPQEAAKNQDTIWQAGDVTRAFSLTPDNAIRLYIEMDREDRDLVSPPLDVTQGIKPW